MGENPGYSAKLTSIPVINFVTGMHSYRLLFVIVSCILWVRKSVIRVDRYIERRL